MTWDFATAWALAKIAGVLFALALMIAPALRLLAEHARDRKRRNRR